VTFTYGEERVKTRGERSSVGFDRFDDFSAELCLRETSASPLTDLLGLSRENPLTFSPTCEKSREKGLTTGEKTSLQWKNRKFLEKRPVLTANSRVRGQSD
jgi:hypothetical protein